MYGAKKRTKRRARERDVFNDLEDRVIALEKLRKKYILYIERQVHKNFLLNEGCQVCRGRGWIVDRLNDECDPSFSICNNQSCNPDTREKSGLDVGYDRFDRLRGLANPCGRQNTMYAVLVTPIDTMICELMSQIIKERRKQLKETA